MDENVAFRSGHRAQAGRFHPVAWEDGYVAAMAGLGDECPHPLATAEAIHWADGHGEAVKTLRFLLDA